MAHAQKPDLVFQRNGRVHLNRRGCQFSRLLAVEECGSADISCIDRVPTYSGRLLATYSIRIFPLPCVTVCHQVLNALYPVTSGYSVERDCAYCICLVWSSQKVAITADCPPPHPKCRLLGAGVVTYYRFNINDIYCASDRSRNSNYLFVDTDVTYWL